MATTGDLHKVWEIKPLKKSGQEEARAFLERIAKQVQPIMRRRKWRVKLLSEFCPGQARLLGTNYGRGIEVRLRLRRSNGSGDFLPYHEVLDTMLHELCHNEHNAHDAQFYKLWDELRLECQDLMAKGIMGTGQGFDGTGRRLGGFSRPPPLSALRQTALAAAQKRAHLESLLPSGSKRLRIGGDTEIMHALTPVQAAAMAAERRLQDDLWCGSGSHEILSAIEINEAMPESGESSKSSIVRTQGKNIGSQDSHKNDNGGKISYVGSQNTRIESTSGGRFSGAPLSNGSSSHRKIYDTEDKTIWECGICTLFNEPLALVCEACGTQKHTAFGSKFKTWSCKFCTLENSTKLEKCSACEEWRYSYGPPVATHGPNYGT